MSIGSDILELQEKIAASLWMQPATLEMLMQRDFLANRADFMVDRLLFIMEGKEAIYGRVVKEEGEERVRYYTYKKYARKLDKKGYELGVD